MVYLIAIKFEDGEKFTLHFDFNYVSVGQSLLITCHHTRMPHGNAFGCVGLSVCLSCLGSNF